MHSLALALLTMYWVTDMYPSKDGKLFATKQQRDVHNASLTYDDDVIISTPFSATRDMNESIRNGAC